MCSLPNFVLNKFILIYHVFHCKKVKLSPAQAQQSFLFLEHWVWAPSRQWYGCPEEAQSVRNFSVLLHHVTESFGLLTLFLACPNSTSVHALTQIKGQPLTLGFSRCVDTEAVSLDSYTPPPFILGCSFTCHTAPLKSMTVTAVPLFLKHWTNITPVKTLLKAPRISMSLWGCPEQRYLTLKTVLTKGLDQTTARRPFQPRFFQDPIKNNFPSRPQHHFHAYCSVISASFPPRPFTRLLKNMHNILAFVTFCCAWRG